MEEIEEFGGKLGIENGGKHWIIGKIGQFISIITNNKQTLNWQKSFKKYFI